MHIRYCNQKNNKYRLKVLLFLSVYILLFSLASVATAATTTLVFTDNASPANPYPATGTVGAFPFSPITTGPQAGQNPEFRIISGGNRISGGGEKSITDTDAAVSWIFNNDNYLSDVLNTDMTSGTDGSQTYSGGVLIPAGPVISPTAPNGGAGLFLNAPVLGSALGFLAPTVGSAAANLYGNGIIDVDLIGGTIEVFFPVLEAQWVNTYMLLGAEDDGINGAGITFNGTLTNVGATTFDFVLTAQHIVNIP